MIDYHIHTKLCRHANGEIIDYIGYAEKLGLLQIGFADHFPMNYQPKFSLPISSLTMKNDEIELYLKIIETAKTKFNNIKIRTGFEVDYYTKDNNFFKNYTDVYYQIDFVSGSIHFIDDLSVDQEEFIQQRKEFGITLVWQKYFSAMIELIKNYREFIDIISHIDLPKKFGDKIDDMSEGLLDEVLKLIKENELVLELNTAGWFKPVEELYPSLKIIKKAKDYGIEFTVGSDAHSPDEIGRGFKRLIKIMNDVGIKRLVTFNKHKKEYFKL